MAYDNRYNVAPGQDTIQALQHIWRDLLLHRIQSGQYTVPVKYGIR